MGVLYFFKWLKEKFSSQIQDINVDKKNIIPNFDNLLIDINGIIHPCCQKIYKYGNYSEIKTLRIKKINKIPNPEIVYEDICEQIVKLYNLIKPKKRLILCIDGVAPIAKQSQQRKRRFVTKSENNFDSNSITAGTMFMHLLSEYLKKYFLDFSKKNKIKIIFSSEKNPGEGEHKLILFLNKYIDIFDNNCIHGLDADLIFLSLLTNMRSIYIIRDDNYFKDISHNLICISDIRYILSNNLRFNANHKLFSPLQSIKDFVFLSFLLGNDFLPSIPSIEISRGSIDDFIEIYKELSINIIDENNLIIKDNFLSFLKILSKREEKFFIDKEKQKDYIKDILLENSFENDKFNLNYYKTLYYFNNLPELFDFTFSNSEKIIDIRFIKTIPFNEEKIIIYLQNYIDTLFWNILYYTKTYTNWNHKFNYKYSPFISTLIENFDKLNLNSINILTPSNPYPQFLQLLNVLPPCSVKLIPAPLCSIKETKEYQIFSPSNIEIDYSGKKKDFEGIVNIPNSNIKFLIDFYESNISKIDKKFLDLNKIEENNYIFSKGKENIIVF